MNERRLYTAFFAAISAACVFMRASGATALNDIPGTTEMYSATETDAAIDALAAYYVTMNAAGDAFPTHAALTNVTTFWSGGEVRVPTRNDYAVVLSDETHGSNEWRYVWAVAAGETNGQWEAQYPIETNDYDELANKPSINGVELIGNVTADELGIRPVADSITDGTNTIDAAGNVYKRTFASWFIHSYNEGNYSPPVECVYHESLETSDGMVHNVWLSKSKIGYAYFGIRYLMQDIEFYGDPVDGVYPVFTGDTLSEYTVTNITMVGAVQCDIRRDSEYITEHIGKLALTNDIPTVDYTTSNAQLVETIEATAPAPGNYSAVSNAAINARSATELGVRGAPQGEGSWFTVNGKILAWNAGSWGDENQSIGYYGDHYLLFLVESEIDFYLDENFSCSINYGTNTYVIIGYTNTLAQVSQIQVLPSGIVTTNENGELFMYGTNVVSLVFGAAQRTEISATDPTFSNAVLSVGLGIGTNAVAAINALVEQGEELPIGGAAGVGALLVAIAAAVAALKRRVTSAETALALKANAADLPYALVEPGKWEFSGVPEGHTITEGPYFQDGDGWIIVLDDVTLYYSDEMSESAMSLTWHYDADGATITASRASLPGQLLDRAVNAVSVTGATTLTLPALVNAGKARDFLVKVTTSADDLNITWQGQGSEAPNGADELQFVTEDGDFPVVGTAGDYLFSFTEIEPHTFAVSMKPIVAAPQAQGGS